MSTIFPVGTRTVFQQTSAPTGWTKITTFNNHALRVVSGTASSGGTQDFTSVFSITVWGGVPFTTPTTGATTLTVPNITPHTHTPAPFPSRRIWTTTGVTPGGTPTPVAPTVPILGNTAAPTLGTTGNAGVGQGHSHTVTFSAAGNLGDMSVRYVDIIVASKN